MRETLAMRYALVSPTVDYFSSSSVKQIVAQGNKPKVKVRKLHSSTIGARWSVMVIFELAHFCDTLSPDPQRCNICVIKRKIHLQARHLVWSTFEFLELNSRWCLNYDIIERWFNFDKAILRILKSDFFSIYSLVEAWGRGKAWSYIAFRVIYERNSEGQRWATKKI